MSTGTFPNSFKIAKITPLYKKENPQSFENYRSISILPSFSKLLERLIHSRLLNHLNSNNILFKGQFGFRSHHSTELAINNLTDKVNKCMEKKLWSLCLFIDLRRAYDTLNPDILL